MFRKGMCFGLSVYWGNGKLIDVSRRNTKNDVEFVNDLKTVLIWNGTTEGLSTEINGKTIRDVIQNILSIVCVLQCPWHILKLGLEKTYSQEDFPEFLKAVKYFDRSVELDMCYASIVLPCGCKKIPKLEKIFDFSFLFTPDSLTEFVKWLPKEKVIIFSANEHAISLFCNSDGTYMFYDPNYAGGPFKLKRDGNYLKILRLCLLFGETATHFEIGVDVYDFDGAKPMKVDIKKLFSKYVEYLGTGVFFNRKYDAQLLNRCLIFLASRDSFEYGNSLVELGANIDHVDRKGINLAMYAAKYARLDIVRSLVEGDIRRLEYTDRSGLGIVECAMKSRNRDVIMYTMQTMPCIAWEKDIGSGTTRLVMIMHRVNEYGNMKILNFIDRGCILWERHTNSNGFNLLMNAVLYGNVELLTIVLGWLFTNGGCYIRLLMEKAIWGQTVFDILRSDKKIEREIKEAMFELLNKALDLAGEFAE